MNLAAVLVAKIENQKQKNPSWPTTFPKLNSRTCNNAWAVGNIL